MMALSIVIAAVTSVWREVGVPRWLAGIGGLTVLALVASALGYLASDQAWANAASVSLPLLLIWVLGTAVTVGHARRPVYVARASAAAGGAPR